MVRSKPIGSKLTTCEYAIRYDSLYDAEIAIEEYKESNTSSNVIKQIY